MQCEWIKLFTCPIFPERYSMVSKFTAVIFALAYSASLVHAAGSATVNVQNKCDKPQAYRIESKGSALDTSLSPRSSKSTKLNHGDKVKVSGNVIHTVAASSDGKTVLVCNK